MDKEVAKKMTRKWYADKRLEYIRSCTDSETLHLCAFNYNWTNGFDEPTAYISNPVCSMSTALQLFYDSDGLEYLSDPEQEVDEYQEPWFTFVDTLYHRIIAGDFPSVPIKFEPPVSRVELYQMEKDLIEEERVFITPIDGVDCNIQL